jgi:hypothetical protein
MSVSFDLPLHYLPHEVRTDFIQSWLKDDNKVEMIQRVFDMAAIMLRRTAPYPPNSEQSSRKEVAQYERDLEQVHADAETLRETRDRLFSNYLMTGSSLNPQYSALDTLCRATAHPLPIFVRPHSTVSDEGLSRLPARLLRRRAATL